MKIQELFEEIKGWKHAGRDLAKHRATVGKDVKLVRVKKDGTESKMNDATKLFRTEDEARRQHETMVKLNPKTSIKHNLYVDGKKVELLEGILSDGQHPMDILGARKKYDEYVAQMKKAKKPHISFGSWALYNQDRLVKA